MAFSDPIPPGSEIIDPYVENGTFIAPAIQAGTITSTSVDAVTITGSTVSATDINGGTITGSHFISGSGAKRIEIKPGDKWLEFYGQLTTIPTFGRIYRIGPATPVLVITVGNPEVIQHRTKVGGAVEFVDENDNGIEVWADYFRAITRIVAPSFNILDSTPSQNNEATRKDYVDDLTNKGWTDISSFIAGWQNVTGEQNAQYRLMGNTVEIRGTVERVSGSSTAIFNLPSEIRPINQQNYATVVASSHGHLRVEEFVLRLVSATILISNNNVSINCRYNIN